MSMSPSSPALRFGREYPPRPYNHDTLMRYRLTISSLRFALVAFCLVWTGARLFAQPAAGAHTLLIVPFENDSKSPGLEWIAEAFPEVLGERMASQGMYVISRDERVYAFDRFGIPQTLRPSRATLYRIAESKDADFVIFGEYAFDGNVFNASAQVLDMKTLKLTPPAKADGPLPSLLQIQDSLAWELLKQMGVDPLPPKEQFVSASTPVRLDAFENYIRGVVATTRAEKIRRFREALRLNPEYNRALLQLGRVYLDAKDYDSASAQFARISRTGPLANQASFLLGLATFYRGDYEKSEAAFRFLVDRTPLPEVYNNLGVVAGRRGKRAAVEYLQKAVAADPNDSNYRLNLAIVLYRNGDTGGAVRQLREILNRRPDDPDAKNMLTAITGAAVGGVHPDIGQNAAAKLPAERMQSVYNEASYQQVAMEIANLAAQRLAKADPRERAAYYIDHGRDMLNKGFPAQAEQDFREALRQDSSNAAAHAGLARSLEASDADAAASEAEAAIRIKPSAEAYLVLARCNAGKKDLQRAIQNIESALALEPANSAALALKQSIESKMNGAQEP